MLSIINKSLQLIPRGVAQIKNISTTTPQLVKQIEITEENGAMTIQAVTMPSPRSDKMMKEACETKFCPECTLGLDIKHTDVLILSQYVRSDGCMLPKRVTGLCNRQQKKMGTLVTMAQKAGLMPNLAPEWGKRDPKKRFQWKKYNKYFLEANIKV